MQKKLSIAKKRRARNMRFAIGLVAGPSGLNSRGLELQQMQYFLRIYEAGEEGVDMATIANDLGYGQPAVSRNCRRFYKKGLVSIRLNDNHRGYRYLVSLTDKARIVIEDFLSNATSGV